MSNNINLHPIFIDLNDDPNNGIQSSSTPISLETTDYGKLLRMAAAINFPSIRCSIICIALDIIFALIMLAMGAANRSSCTMEARIPVFLIVFACTNFIYNSLSIAAGIIHIRKKEKNLLEFYFIHISAVIIIILLLFNYIWLILGTVWIFGIFDEVQYAQNEEDGYCERYFYQYSIVAAVVEYIIPILLCFCKNIPLKC